MKTHNQKKYKKKNFSIFDILMENGNNKLMNIHNKLIFGISIGIIALFLTFVEP
jgi:hypothetical protein